MKSWNMLDQYTLYEPRLRDLLTTFNMFCPVTDDMVKKLVRSMQSKAFLKFLKECLDDFVTLLSLIVSKSLEDTCFSEKWKTVVVRSLIERCNLTELTNTTDWLAISYPYQCLLREQY